ncbi:response regulator receiver domain protein [Aeromicrobium marinum DSM 15272]|uniref:Response regulator receiver domain protein n=1 Tax=Aeromicrobium marinum DSM 15272 TaxID=585531 RepID=E2SD68_9ACTN|nr:response regulator transcription factor [Aeromicrobium marinum]EFQ83171.1 response regulator receiver domain protein [Aeromicrobium marinum DSM 15272]
MSVRVLVVDDDALVRAGLTLILGGAADLEVVGECPDGREAVAAVRSGGVDLVLMDIRMPVLDGISATGQIRGLTDPPHVIVLTTFDADDLVVRALAAGASGFLLKDTPPAEIISAIHRVVDGEPALSPTVTAQLIRQVTDAAPTEDSTAARARIDLLTEREIEVAVAIGRGRSNAEIAADLHMSLATAKAHISHIFSKLDVTNRVQVAIAMHEADLL